MSWGPFGHTDHVFSCPDFQMLDGKSSQIGYRISASATQGWGEVGVQGGHCSRGALIHFANYKMDQEENERKKWGYNHIRRHSQQEKQYTS